MFHRPWFCLAFKRYLISFPTHSHSPNYYCIMKLPSLSKRQPQTGSPLKRLPEHYMFIKQICAASVFLLVSIWIVAAWIYGSLYQLDDRTKHLKILLVDLDGDVIGKLSSRWIYCSRFQCPTDTFLRQGRFTRGRCRLWIKRLGHLHLSAEYFEV